MIQSELWDQLIYCKDKMIEIFNENGTEIFEPGMEQFNQKEGGWINRVWANDFVRRAHIDVVDQAVHRRQNEIGRGSQL